MTISTRRIDHLVLAVHDLDGAAACYERLGFQVSARNRHPWGTENRLVQLRSSFLELVTVADRAAIPAHGPRSFSFGAFVRDHLDEREGLAMLVLDSDDAAADAAEFARSGIGDFEPFSFERDGRGPDGTVTRVGFGLAFARDPGLPGSAFFVCQQHAPDSFWNPAFQQHPNGATDVSAVSLTLCEPARHADFLSAFTGARPEADGRVFRLRDGGRIEVGAGPGPEGLAAFTVAVPALDPVREHLSSRGVEFHDGRDRLEVGAAEACGVPIRFEDGER